MTTTPVVRTGMHMTLEEFLDLPEQEQRCELIDGVVYVAAFAVPDRAFLITALAANLSQRVMLTGAGIAMMAAGVAVSSDSALAPDITVVRAERAGIIGTRTIDGPPDIVVETLSSHQNRGLARKRQLYEAAGIPEYWIVDGSANTLTALELGEDGRYRERAVLASGDTLTTPLFPEFSLPLARLFDHPARIRP